MCTLTMFSPSEVLKNAMDELSKGNTKEYFRLYKIYKEMV